jgi:hypothetical protein
MSGKAVRLSLRFPKSLDPLVRSAIISILALLESLSIIRKEIIESKKNRPGLGAWPMPLNRVSPVVPFFPR